MYASVSHSVLHFIRVYFISGVSYQKKFSLLFMFLSFFLAYNISLHSIGWLLVIWLASSNRLLHWLIPYCILNELCTLFIFSSFIFLVHFFHILFSIRTCCEVIPYNIPLNPYYSLGYTSMAWLTYIFAQQLSYTLNIFRCCQ